MKQALHRLHPVRVRPETTRWPHQPASAFEELRNLPYRAFTWDNIDTITELGGPRPSLLHRPQHGVDDLTADRRREDIPQAGAKPPSQYIATLEKAIREAGGTNAAQYLL